MTIIWGIVQNEQEELIDIRNKKLQDVGSPLFLVGCTTLLQP